VRFDARPRHGQAVQHRGSDNQRNALRVSKLRGTGARSCFLGLEMRAQGGRSVSLGARRAQDSAVEGRKIQRGFVADRLADAEDELGRDAHGEQTRHLSDAAERTAAGTWTARRVGAARTTTITGFVSWIEIVVLVRLGRTVVAGAMRASARTFFARFWRVLGRPWRHATGQRRLSICQQVRQHTPARHHTQPPTRQHGYAAHPRCHRTCVFYPNRSRRAIRFSFSS
jgi:hypothetical protein